jgi:hypothetical protein
MGIGSPSRSLKRLVCDAVRIGTQMIFQNTDKGSFLPIKASKTGNWVGSVDWTNETGMECGRNNSSTLLVAKR